MRYLFGFICVLALAVMGCGQSLGPVGGSGGDGAGGDGGVGGAGGGVLSDCSGEEDWTPCGTAGEGYRCFDEQCYASDCAGLEDGTTCVVNYMFSFWLNACEAGECVAPEDCTGIADGVMCSIGPDTGKCIGETCYAWGCEAQEDGTKCFYDSDGQRMFGVCMAGECGPEE